jgi:DNA end-binding protein Ku
MATQLVESMSTEWRPDDYKDEFRSKLRKLIDTQIARQSGKKGRAAKVEETQEAPEATTNVVDFMELLKKSLDRKGKAAPAKRERAPRRSAAGERRGRSSRRKAS